MIVDRYVIETALAQYEIGAELGRGGFGLVLAGRHRRLGRPVAIKVLVADVSGGDLDRFAAEARILASLDHPHVVRLHEYVEAAGLCLLVMEQLAGGTLVGWRGAGRSPEASCAIALAVAEALGCAHTAGVLHRDVKPGNVLLTPDGLPKLTDFGIAKLVDGSGGAASNVIGTWAYMAPEQWRAGRLVPATDLYALGGMLYELLTGRPPFPPRMSPQALLRHHLTVVPPPPPGVPEPVAAVVLRALAKNVTDRPPTARAFAVELGRAAAAAFGSDWLVRADVPLLLSDDVLDAVRTTASPVINVVRAVAVADPEGSTDAETPIGPGVTGRAGPAGSRSVGRTRTAPPAVSPVSPAPATAPNPTPGRRRRRGVGVAVATALTVVAVLGVVRLDPFDLDGTPSRPTGAAHQPTGVPGTPAAAAGYHGPTVRVGLLAPGDVTLDAAGSLYVTDYDTGMVHRIGRTGRVDSVAGHGTEGFSGDRGPANRAQLSDASGVRVSTADGRIVISDEANHRIRLVTSDRRISTLAGSGDPTFSGDGGPAADAGLTGPAGLTLDAAGNLYVADFEANRIRRISSTDGTIRTVAGTGEEGFSGDGGPAVQATLTEPCGLAFDAAGNLYVADSGNNRVRRIRGDGRIFTVAGTGGEGFSGEGRTATRALLDSPRRVAVAPDGALYIADSLNHRIRRVGRDGRIGTVAGTGEQSFSGDGGPATQATLQKPDGIAFDAVGNLYVADFGNRRVRRIGTDGKISTVVA